MKKIRIIARRVITQLTEWFAQKHWEYELLDRRVTLLPGCKVTSIGNITVGQDILISHGTFLQGAGGISIGNRVMIGPGVRIITTNHERSSRLSVNRPVAIQDGAWIGAGSIVLPGVTVGENSIVGAGAVVSRTVPPNTVVAGVPAKEISRVEPSIDSGGYFDAPSWRQQFGANGSTSKTL